MTTPTQSEKRIAIAEHFGWIWGQPWGKKSLRFVAPLGYRSQNWRSSSGEVILPLGQMSGRDRKESIIHGLPDYFGDLNATNEAENSLSDEQHGLFRAHLWELTHPDCVDLGTQNMARAYASAPADFRAEAIWQTLCKSTTP